MTSPAIDQPTPVPGPPQLNSMAWWIALLTIFGDFAVGVGVLIGHPIDSAIVTSVVTAVAIAAATVAALFTHRSVVMVKMAHYNAQISQHNAVAAARMNVQQMVARKALEPGPLEHGTLLETVDMRGTPENPMYVEVVGQVPLPSIAPPQSPPPAKATRGRAHS